MFLDENRDGPRLVAALTGHGFVVHRYRDHFPRGLEDERWVPDVVSRSWVILTTDRGRGDKIMMMVLRQCCATALIVSNRTPLEESAAALFQHQRRVQRAISDNAPPLILYVGRAHVTAHDFDTGARLRVLGNGKIKKPTPIGREVSPGVIDADATSSHDSDRGERTI